MDLTPSCTNNLRIPKLTGPVHNNDVTLQRNRNKLLEGSMAVMATVKKMSSSESNQQASPPEWLNKSFLEKVLRSADDDPTITVTSVDINPATAPGDNYMSMIYRAKVHMTKGGQMQHRSLIVKTMSLAANIQQVIDHTVSSYSLFVRSPWHKFEVYLSATGTDALCLVFFYVVSSTAGEVIPDHRRITYLPEKLPSKYGVHSEEYLPIDTYGNAGSGRNVNCFETYTEVRLIMHYLKKYIYIYFFLQFTKASHIFEEEIMMLKDVIPAMHRVLDEVMPGKYHPFAARHIYSHVNEESYVIILEDLKELGYRNHERTTGLDMEHCIVVLRSLAQFHAASVALKKREPELIEPFMYVKKLKLLTEGFRDFVSNSILKLANDVEKWPEYGEKYAHKIRDFSVNTMDKNLESRNRIEDEFNVLSHGDLWVNNMMFRYDTDKDIDVRFVDYQLSYWVSPAVDLQFFLNSSTTIDLLDKHHLLVDEYHKTLGETLTLLGFEHLHPTRETLEKQLVERRILGTLMVFTMRSIVLADSKSIDDVNEMIQKLRSYDYSELYKEYLKSALPLLDENGWS
ncbi:hypothetical protein ANN_04516 [Periplaneta americana]|uniref:CHK kinase-like domain-containing protein n=1 Tax=Periplaneta americana TaxID=6978 RepID=A0ABQ8TB61_PERAM|nr:hypothetical protein ANN_04516 [Periplaneta americana]